jgi:hypothetical protein
MTADLNVDVKMKIENFSNLVHIDTEPTFQTNNVLSTIDHAFTNVSRCVTSVIECPYSDHKILAVALF